MVALDGDPLSIDELVAVARFDATVEVTEEARRRMAGSRSVVEQLESSDTIAYGVTTGFGALADRAIAPADRATLSRRVVLATLPAWARLSTPRWSAGCCCSARERCVPGIRG